MKTILVLGATGGVGGETARAFAARGWHVRALTRSIRPGMDPFEWVIGDAMDRASVIAAATGADAILHAVNPPGYRHWDTLVLPMIDNSIAAAQASGARVLLPGTIYNFDPATTPLLSVDSPQRPATRKGKIRRDLEARIAQSGVRALILRAGDFFGPRPGGNWYSQGLVKPGKPVTSMTIPWDRGVGHGWAYLPDVAETFVRLVEREADLPVFARFHMEGVWDADGTRMIAATARGVGNPALRTQQLPWSLLPLAGLFSPMMREMVEMRPFWRNPMRLDNRELVAFLGEEPRTPLDAAIRTTLQGIGCLA